MPFQERLLHKSQSGKPAVAEPILKLGGPSSWFTGTSQPLAQFPITQVS
jgi:hypothetical protein